MIAYFNGKFLPENKIHISPNDRGFLFADGIYEVIRSYNGNLFKAEAHFARLSEGAGSIRLGKFDYHSLIDIVNELLIRNDLVKKDSTIYIQVTRGVAEKRTHHFPIEKPPLTVLIKSSAFTPKVDEIKHGINALLVTDKRWARCDIKSTGLLLNVLAQQQAKENDASEALFVRNGCITEGSHTNIFSISNGNVITPPRSNYILSGITRQAVIDLCIKSNISVKEQTLFESDALEGDELFISGTTVEITPIVQINGNKFRNGSPGPITRKLQEMFEELKQHN